ncbi:MAG: oxidoreductase [Thermoflexibacter sp.]|nr:oxidoreductase [Thermoflexibacter sp.]
MTALLLGASGLTGSYCLQALLASNQYDKVITPLRKNIAISHHKLHQLIIDFDNLELYKEEMTADVIFCCLGTTIKKVGTKEKFKQIDYHYPLQFARLGKQQGAHTFVLVSALGADVKSLFFYSRVKGELERDLKALNFETLIVLQPSLLLGDRKEDRAGEKTAIILSAYLNWLIPPKYRAIKAEQIGQAMVKLSLQGLKGLIVKESDEIKKV